MVEMRKFILAFLAFLVVMPSLACALPVCKSEAAEFQPCHPAAYEQSNQNETGESGAFMLFVDCMEVDFSSQDVADNGFAPNKTSDMFDFAWRDLTAGYDFKLVNINAIRGSPDIDGVRSPSRPLYLTTQRLRI